MTNCSGPPCTGATLIAAVSKMHSSARSHTRSISIELVCVNKYSNFSVFQMLVQACLLKHSVKSSLFIYIYMNNRGLEINFVNMLYVSFIFFSSSQKKKKKEKRALLSSSHYLLLYCHSLSNISQSFLTIFLPIISCLIVIFPLTFSNSYFLHFLFNKFAMSSVYYI